MLAGSQGWLLAKGVLMLNDKCVDEAISLMTFVTRLPNEHFRAWAYFFLGVARQNKALTLIAAAEAHGQTLNGL